jgi:hypothetical protein
MNDAIQNLKIDDNPIIVIAKLKELMKFPHYKQLDSMDCGPTCLRMIAKYYGKIYILLKHIFFKKF